MKKGSWIISFLFFLLAFAQCTSLENRIERAARIQKAKKELRGEEYQRALLRFEKTLKEDPKNTNALEGVILALIRLGRYYEAIAYIGKRTELEPPCSLCDFYLGESYRALDKCSFAIKHYKKALKKRPGSKQILRSLSWALYEEGEFEEGYQLINEVYRRSPFDVDTTIIRIRFLLELKDFKAVLKTSDEALHQVKKAKLKAQFYSFKGDVHTGFLQFGKAKKFYQKALFLQPLLGSALLGLGKNYYFTKQEEKAEKYLTQALRVSRRFFEGYYYLAKIAEADDPERAQIFYQKFYRMALAENKDYGALLKDVKKRLQSKK